MITLKICPVCGSGNIKQYGWAGVSPRRVDYEMMPGVFVKASIISYYSECQNCQLIFQNPRLTEDELDKYYSLGYYRKLHHLSLEQSDDLEAKRAKLDAGIIKKYIKNIKTHLDVGCSRGFLLGEVGAKKKLELSRMLVILRLKG